MGLKPNKTPTEIRKGGAFGGTYFRDICWLIMRYSGVNNKWHKTREKNLMF